MEDDYGDLDDPHAPLQEDLIDAENDDECLECPSCGSEIHEDTQKCPYCGDWIVPHQAAAEQRHWIWILAALMAILGIVWISVR